MNKQEQEIQDTDQNIEKQVDESAQYMLDNTTDEASGYIIEKMKTESLGGITQDVLEKEKNQGEKDQDVSNQDANSHGETKQDRMNQQKRNENYNRYVETVTPKASCLKNCIKAFITGGCICTVGQLILWLFSNMGLDKDTGALWTTVSLVAISVILTGFGIYPLITTWGGAGSLVPITGFANGVAAPAIEYKKEGQVFGIGCKIFTIAGPVILYGIFTSWVVGLIYYVCKCFGVL